ncbi:MAG: ABC transporter substrate-binding protein [Alphaproteobacteria bacterium]|nr:MAG: ABC transporter substrate-binding protein [Alphaproteobacteria bacterium]
MTTPPFSYRLDRRTVLKGTAAAGLVQVTAPFIIQARGEAPLRIGMIDPLTGVYAAPAQNEVTGAKLAVDQMNAKGGILGRPVELLVEDSANDVGTGVQKARKLIERDQVTFLIGDVNSGIAQAIAQVTNEKKVLHIVSGGHTDTITGKDCKWNVYRVCNTTRMEANSVSDLLFNKYGKKWHFVTPDYAFGHTLQGALDANLKRLGGTVTGNELTPLGTTDFSAYLIKARAANPDVLLLLVQGSDMINCLKQIVQFGIDKQIHVAGTQQELESLEGLPPEARIGIWMFEWYWKQAGVPNVAEFVAEIRKRNGGKVPTARHWFGYTSAMTFALVANREKSVDSLQLARALGDFELPPEVKLQPNKCYYRKGDHQLMTSAFIGEAVSNGKDDPEDLFRVDNVVPGDKTSPAETETGCALQWPA